MPTDATTPTPLHRKPSRAETARANGTLSHGPVTETGKRRSSMNSLVHGLRAQRHVAVEALGESAEANAAHLTAVRAELGAVGPTARHLTETVAAGILRAGRAERLEGELLAGLAEDGGSLAAVLFASRDARAALALVMRYRREAEGEVRRALDTLLRLHRARTEALLPDGEAAAAAEQALDQELAEAPAPSEPRIEKIVAAQELAAPAANDDNAPPPPPPRATGETMLANYRFELSWSEERAARYWARLSAKDQAAVLAAAEAERRAKAEGRDPVSLHAAAAPLLR